MWNILYKQVWRTFSASGAARGAVSKPVGNCQIAFLMQLKVTRATCAPGRIIGGLYPPTVTKPTYKIKLIN